MADEVNAGGWRSGRVLLAVAMAMIFGVLLGFGYREILVRNQARDAQRATARGIVDAIMLRYHWEKWETDSERRPFLDNLGRQLENQQYRWDFLSPNSSGTGVPQDEFEHTALRVFQNKDAAAAEKAPSMDRIITNPDGKRRYEYLQPIYVKKNCTHCHNTLVGAVTGNEPGQYHEGDLMAVVKVVQDIAD